MTTMPKLEGAELLDCCINNAGADEAFLMQKAGYSTVRNGKVALKKTEFFHALMRAKGIDIAPNKLEKPKSQPSFRVKASKRGVLPIAQCYSSLIDIGPNEVARIETEGTGNDTVLVISKEIIPVDIDESVSTSCGI